MKIFLGLILVTFTFFTITKVVWAKTLPQSLRGAGKQTVSAKTTGTNIGVSPKIRTDRNALIVNFSNLQNATSVSYLLTYKQGNSQQEGAGGVITLNGSSTDTAELLFGTCSKNVCRYHTNIADAKLEVTYTNKSGKKYLKRFKIRV